MRLIPLAAAVSIAILPVAASAQFGLPAGIGGGLGGIGSAGVGNMAGLLGYCVKNKLTGGAAAQTVLGKLTGQPAVTNSPGYAQGLLGKLTGSAAPTTTTSTASGFSLDSLKGGFKTKACDLVLKRAGSFM